MALYLRYTLRCASCDKNPAINHWPWILNKTSINTNMNINEVVPNVRADVTEQLQRCRYCRVLDELDISSQHIILCYELIEGHGTKTAHNTSRLVQLCWRKKPHNTAGGSIREPDRHAKDREAGVHRTINRTCLQNNERLACWIQPREKTRRKMCKLLYVYINIKWSR